MHFAIDVATPYIRKIILFFIIVAGYQAMSDRTVNTTQSCKARKLRLIVYFDCSYLKCDKSVGSVSRKYSESIKATHNVSCDLSHLSSTVYRRSSATLFYSYHISISVFLRAWVAVFVQAAWTFLLVGVVWCIAAGRLKMAEKLRILRDSSWRPNSRKLSVS